MNTNVIFFDREMMRKDVFIFRHGETDYNREKRWQGSGVDTSLNETGVLQAEKLAKQLAELNLEIIYSSPLKRARQTAQIAADCLGIPLEIIPDLTEGCFGEAEGMLKDEVAKKFSDIFMRWYAPENELDIKFPGGETKRQMQERMLRVLSRLENTPYKTIGLASHGSSIRYLLLAFGRQPTKMANTALYHLFFDKNTWHLSDESA